jgi:dolichol-phosphate mannosyltransferase
MPTSQDEGIIPGPHFRADRSRPELSVVIPVFEEEDVLPLLIERLTRVLDGMNLTSEVIFVDDGSDDDTLDLIAQANRSDARIRALCLSRNFGHQAAISAGLAEARGNAVAVMDGDLQDPPEALPLLYKRLREGNDVVYAIRASRPESWPKRLAYRLFYRLLQRSVSVPMPLDAGDFGLMSRRVVDVLNQLPERRRFVRGLRAWAGFRQVGVPIEREPRGGGRPKYTWAKLVMLAVDGLVGFSETPLRWAGALGFGAMGLALTGAMAGLLAGISQVWVWVGLLVLFFGGAQLFSTAILGEYVCRTLHEAQGRPAYVVRRRIGIEAAESRGGGSRKSATRRVPPRG